MSLSATTVIELRADGNNANGGAYDSALTGGVDYTYPTPQVFVYTDIVIVTSTTISSVARPFITADIGNVLNIISGTGFTVGRYRIISVSAGVATVSSVIGTPGSVNGNGRLGGALQTFLGLSTMLTGTPAGLTIWVKGGTSGEHSIIGTNNTTPITMPAVGTATAPTKILGYGEVRGDNIKPVLRTASTVSIPSSKGVLLFLDNYIIRNLSFTSFSGAYTTAYSNVELRGANLIFNRCDITGGFTLFCASPARIVDCQLRDTDVFVDIYFATASGRTVFCNDIGIFGGRYVGNVGSISVTDCRSSISPTRNVAGINQANVNTGVSNIVRTTLFGGSIVSTQPTTTVERCVVVSSGGTGISLVAGGVAVDNALFGNTSKYGASTFVLNDVNLTENPLNLAPGDLRPNNIGGGGKVLREFASSPSLNPYGSNLGATGRIGGMQVPITSDDISSISSTIFAQFETSDMFQRMSAGLAMYGATETVDPENGTVTQVLTTEQGGTYTKVTESTGRNTSVTTVE